MKSIGEKLTRSELDDMMAEGNGSLVCVTFLLPLLRIISDTRTKPM